MVTALAVAASSAHAEKKRKKKRHRTGVFTIGDWNGDLTVRARAVAGALSGRSTLRTNGVLVDGEVATTPAIERGRWRLELPLEIGHRETPGAELRETRGALDLEARWRRGPRFRIENRAGLRAVWRPDWLDEYQPGAGGLMTTDRYSHWDRRLETAVAAIPVRHQHARLALAYERVDHAEDPTYDPIDAPTHLVPGDHDQVGLDGSWRYLGDGWSVRGGFELERERWFHAYSRDAGTGLTHAGTGGPPPNPLYREISFEPSAGGELDLLGERLELSASYGYLIVSDRYQGYYSSRAHHPELDVAWKQGGLELHAGFDALVRAYGPGSYAPGVDHPPLDDGGDRRVDRKLSTRLRARWAVGRQWAVVAAGEMTQRRTNFPDYVPGVFPDTRAYDIRWDYTNWELTAGIEVTR